VWYGWFLYCMWVNTYCMRVNTQVSSCLEVYGSQTQACFVFDEIIYTHVNTYMCVCVYICMYVCIYVYAYICISSSISNLFWIMSHAWMIHVEHLYVHICICMYIYMYVYSTYTRIYVCIFACIHVL